MGITWKTLHGIKGRIVGTLFALLTLFAGVYLILFTGSFVRALFGVLFIVVSIYELAKVLLQSNYSIDITQG